MIRRSRLSLSLRLAITCLALVFSLRGKARAENANTAHATAAAPAAKPSTTPAPASAPTLVEAPLPRGPEPESPPGKPGEAATLKEALAAATKKPAKERTIEELHGLLNLGGSLTERGDYEAADIAYRQVLDAPKATEAELKPALLGLAHMHRKQGAAAKAAAIYERFLKDYTGDERTPDTLLALGRTYRDIGAYNMAISRFYSVINSTLKPSPEGFDRYQVLAKTAQFEIAETHFQFGEFAQAAKFYTKFRLLDIAPADRARAHFKAGYALRLQGDLEGAVTQLRAYISQWPDDENMPQARYELAITLRELKRTQEAFNATLDLLRTEKSRIAANPKRWAYWQLRTGNQLANDFFENGDTLNAHAIYAGLLELSPDTSWRLPISYQLALCYERLGLVDRARSSYQSIVDAAGPTPPADYAELARMAAWRIEHLEWRERVGTQVTSFFESTTRRQTAQVPAAAPKAPGAP